jgi:DNA-binding transcriptional MerR regulator
VRIGELAGKTGVSVRALRYYEEQELLASERSPSGQRHYPDSAVDRVQLIQQLYAAGLSSRSILDLLPCVITGVAAPESLEWLKGERDRISAEIRTLLGARDRLDRVIAAAVAKVHPNLQTADPLADGGVVYAGLSGRGRGLPRRGGGTGAHRWCSTT